MVKPEKMIDDDYFQGFLDGIQLVRMTIRHCDTMKRALYRIKQHISAAKRLNKSLREAKE